MASGSYTLRTRRLRPNPCFGCWRVSTEFRSTISVAVQQPDASVIASDGRVEFDAIPGHGGIVLGTLWGSDEALVYPDGGGEPSHRAWFPPVGGTRLVEFVQLPNSSPTNPDRGLPSRNWPPPRSSLPGYCCISMSAIPACTARRRPTCCT
jgi:hypothetical protein